MDDQPTVTVADAPLATDPGPSGRREAPAHPLAGSTSQRGPEQFPPPSPTAARRAEAARERVRRVLGVGHASVPAPPRPTAAAWVLTALAVACSLAYQLLTRASMTASGSMWAEMGTNYYRTTTTEPWYAQLVATDAGYIPLPQRVIALVGHAIGVPAASIPYYYTGAALLLSSALVGSLCLPAFRRLVDSDLLRFLLALALVLVPDLETKTFINVSYLTVVLAGALAALAVDRRHEVPVWSWVLPVLVVSKPAVLAVLPVMVVASTLGGRRFRRVALVSLLAGAVQVVRLVLSAGQQGSLLQDSRATLGDKLVATTKYTVGILGRGVVGPGHHLSDTAWMVAGSLLLLVAVGVVAGVRSRAGALVVVGLSLVLFDMLLDSFSFSAFFTTEMPMLGFPTFDRRYVVAVVGILFVVAGSIAAVLESVALRELLLHRTRAGAVPTRRALGVLAALVFAAWFAASGWLPYAAQVNRPPAVPSSGMSGWAESAALLESDQPVVCIPLDPFGWSYGKNCQTLAGDPIDPATVTFRTLPDQPGRVEVDAPARVTAGRLAAFSIVLRAASATDVHATAEVTTASGTTVLTGTEHLPAGGGAVTLRVPDGGTLPGVRRMSVAIDVPVDVAWSPDPAAAPLVLWMGQP